MNFNFLLERKGRKRVWLVWVMVMLDNIDFYLFD